MNTEAAVIIMAQKLVHDAVCAYLEDAWERYPEIGEHDFVRVASQASALALLPALHAEAYAALAARAEH